MLTRRKLASAARSPIFEIASEWTRAGSAAFDMSAVMLRADHLRTLDSPTPGRFDDGQCSSPMSCHHYGRTTEEKPMTSATTIDKGSR